MCIAFLFSIKFLEIFEISQKLKSFSSPRARKYISFSMLRFFRFFDQLYLREMTINDSFTHEFEMFFETFFSIKCTPLRHSRFRIKIPDFYQFLFLFLFSSLRNTPPWKIFYRVRSTSSFYFFENVSRAKIWKKGA